MRLYMEGKKEKDTITNKGKAKSPFMLNKLPSLTNLIFYQRKTKKRKTKLQSGDKSGCVSFCVGAKWGKKLASVGVFCWCVC